MPGLINKAKRSALPLSVSDITSCVRGYTLAMTASMTYENIEDHPIEGIFIYPLEEGSVVVGFEAMISTQIITVQIKDKTKIEDCYFDYCTSTNGNLQSGNGHMVLDEDLERMVLVVNLGVIPPLETVNVLVSTSYELPTLSNGGIRVTSPPACTPRVQRSIKEEQAFSPNTNRKRDRHLCSMGSHEQMSSSNQLCLFCLLEEESINSIDYEFNFQLEIRSPYLLAGVESPSHAIRADADPSAHSATSIVVTLADKYTYDCPVEILIYPSEPHLPHVLMEDGDMTLEEYDEHLKGRSDYIKAIKKDSSNEKKVDIIHKRLHKDILHNPVVMLNFCPDLQSMTSDLRRMQGEFIFLIDRSGSMRGANIGQVKDAMVVILKSLFPACLFNIIGFGSKFKPLFATSQSYDEDSLSTAGEHIKKIRADMGGTNILDPLNWILKQPANRGHPRILFILTDGAVNNTGKVIELVRSHARFIRCYTFGIGQGACRRLIQGVATVSRGAAEFLAEGERLQPKMIKCLKRFMAPVLSDITIEWLYPETKEVLLSPVGTTFLFPGDRLIGYSVVCDTTRYHPNPKTDKRRRYSMMRSNESTSSVFYHSQEEEPGKSGLDGHGAASDASGTGTGTFDAYQSSMSEFSPGIVEQDGVGTNISSSPRRRAYSTNQIEDYNPGKKAYTSSDPSSLVGKNPLRRAKAQELIGQTSPDNVAQWKMNYQPQLASLCAVSSKGCGSLLPDEPHGDTDPEETQVNPSVHSATIGLNKENGSKSSSDSPSLGSTGETDGYTHQLCEAETPQDPHAPDFKSISKVEGDCKAVISGLLCGKPVKWEVCFDIEPYLQGREREEKVHEDLWNETFHHLAARSIIQDFEQMANKECEIEHGSGRRYQLYAMQTSKACNILSKYTAFVPIDLDSNDYLPISVEFVYTGEERKGGSHSSQRSGSRKSRRYPVGSSHSQPSYLADGDDQTTPTFEDKPSPCSTPSSAGWERFSFTEGAMLKRKKHHRSVCFSLPEEFSGDLRPFAEIGGEPLLSQVRTRDRDKEQPHSELSFTRTRLLTKAARGFMCRAQGKADSVGESDNDNKNYIPLVSLQLSCGAFVLNAALCEAIHVPMDKLKWTSPFTSHRLSLPHLSHSSSRRTDSLEVQHSSSPPPRDSDLSESEDTVAPRSPRTESTSSGLAEVSFSCSFLQSDSGLGSDLGYVETPVSPGGLQRMAQEPEGMVWATAVALAWLENNSASYFIEWELIAAKASLWLDAQVVPEGRELAAVKAAANQLFIILRHWDENLQLNMLCYNPNSV
ncbi:von Willebrand factor A domain-containing protein 5B1 [Bagarius yarrelli]|uniref:von Willebrand factor A domain-containing protein 5B1 n=1 Tax=Bagarius yarrelli TaxID=175774 RepID=A0A556U0A6_BAGYA|nr:von Willebrand factor A domain-containing protein 5B1 [Bagarius yarrelli]